VKGDGTGSIAVSLSNGDQGTFSIVIDAKGKGQEVHAAAEPEQEEPTDLMAALRASLESAQRGRPRRSAAWDGARHGQRPGHRPPPTVPAGGAAPGSAREQATRECTRSGRWRASTSRGARRRSMRPGAIALAFCAFAFGIAWYAYLPVRSAAVSQARLDPTLRLGLPHGRVFWDSDHPATRAGVLREVGGQDYGPGGAFGRMLQRKTYVDGLPPYLDDLLAEFTPVGPGLAILGFAALWRRDEAGF